MICKQPGTLIMFGAMTVFNECIVQWGFKKCQRGVFSLEDKKGYGRTSSPEDNVLRDLVKENPRINIQKLLFKFADLLKAIEMVKKLKTWVLHTLNDQQTKHC